jgi:hypothetical protein
VPVKMAQRSRWFLHPKVCMHGVAQPHLDIFSSTRARAASPVMNAHEPLGHVPRHLDPAPVEEVWGELPFGWCCGFSLTGTAGLCPSHSLSRPWLSSGLSPLRSSALRWQVCVGPAP